jgi:hypothetical protein
MHPKDEGKRTVVQNNASQAIGAVRSLSPRRGRQRKAYSGGILVLVSRAVSGRIKKIHETTRNNANKNFRVGSCDFVDQDSVKQDRHYPLSLPNRSVGLRNGS